MNTATTISHRLFVAALGGARCAPAPVPTRPPSPVPLEPPPLPPPEVPGPDASSAPATPQPEVLPAAMAARALRRLASRGDVRAP